ncbi:hypothetical protein [Beggiatoa leptomitoformis]|uniref:Tetratricopeptide repeat protein n=1 Tax=Beggiatoa leptomitoformis TaxID=288004 RepID=A0A2N9YAK0_9GAMM|nr:hypothetical protein [Beggiatoa leptomitoformis]ALG67124.1 hypothetical protein AL038_04615 [Beggiatoa leptomitoformis]AUI67480.1 hypothetical protein BLE401_01390 [Beggiatoa leptomitoformis]
MFTDCIFIDEYDIAIFVLDQESVNAYLQSQSIELLNILDSDFQECFILGYPANRLNHRGELESYRCSYDITHEVADEINPQYEVISSDKSLSSYGCKESKNIRGLSGSGVFTQQKNTIYLVGIQKEVRKPFNLKCIDLRRAISIVNEVLKTKEYPPIPVKEIYEGEITGVDFERFDLDAALEILKNSEEIQKISENDGYQSIKNRKNDKLREYQKNLYKQQKILADLYLHRGIVCHKQKDNRRASFNFAQAIKYAPDYKVFFLIAKNLRINSKTENNEISIEDNYLELLRLYEHQDPDNIEIHIIEKKITVSCELAEFYFQVKNYSRMETYLLNDTYFFGQLNLICKKTNSISIDAKELLVSLTQKLYKLVYGYILQKSYFEAEKILLEGLEQVDFSLIDIVQQLPNCSKYKYVLAFGVIDVFCKQKKYPEALFWWNNTFKLLKSSERFYIHAFEFFVRKLEINNGLGMSIEDSKYYYKLAKNSLNKIRVSNLTLSQNLELRLRKLCFSITTRMVEENISSDNKLKEDIQQLQNSVAKLTNDYPLVKEQLLEIKQLLEKKFSA